jgi:dihydrofolate reductase
MSLSAIVAISQNNVIGRDNTLPWHLSEDLKHFKAITLGHTIIMGRKTFESIGKPLPGRVNIVVTRNPNYQAEGITSVSDFETWIKKNDSDEEIFLIGGAGLYKDCWNYVDKIYLTRIEQNFEGDTFFPWQNPLENFQVTKDSGLLTAQNGLPYRLIEATRIS